MASERNSEFFRLLSIVYILKRETEMRERVKLEEIAGATPLTFERFIYNSAKFEPTPVDQESWGGYIHAMALAEALERSVFIFGIFPSPIEAPKFQRPLANVSETDSAHHCYNSMYNNAFYPPEQGMQAKQPIRLLFSNGHYEPFIKLLSGEIPFRNDLLIRNYQANPLSEAETIRDRSQSELQKIINLRETIPTQLYITAVRASLAGHEFIETQRLALVDQQFIRFPTSGVEERSYRTKFYQQFESDYRLLRTTGNGNCKFVTKVL